MQSEHLEMFEQDAAVAVDDRFGHASRARGIQHVQRMIGGDLLELDGPGMPDEFAPAGCFGHRVTAEVRQCHCGAQAGQPGTYGLDLVAPINVTTAVPIAVDHQQHLGVDLPESIEHRLHSELRCATGPHGPEARRGQEGNDRLRHVGEVGGHPVAAPDSEALQTGSCPPDLVGELVPCHRGRWSRLRVGDDRRSVTVMAENVLGIVEPGVDEPPGAGHRCRVEHEGIRPAGVHLEELPNRGPEPGKVVDRPLPQCLVRIERPVAALTQVGDESADVAVRYRFGRGGPEGRGGRHVILLNFVSPNTLDMLAATKLGSEGLDQW